MNPDSLPLQLVCTDFDGTIHNESAVPHVADSFQELIAGLQRNGVMWVINTGRELASLMEEMARARFRIKPDYCVVVEREIYIHEENQYLPVHPWNRNCDARHAELFDRIKDLIPPVFDWVNRQFTATVYADDWSPFCMIGEDSRDTERVVAELETRFADHPDMVVMCNDVYARLSHRDYNKGTALAEIQRLTGILPEQTFIAGDHLNDLPMFDDRLGRWLMTPSNAVPKIHDHIRQIGGRISSLAASEGVEEVLQSVLRSADS